MKVKNANRNTWSFRLGRMLGVDVYVHFTFLLLLGFITAQAATLPPRVGVSGTPMPLTLPEAIRLALEEIPAGQG